MIPVLILVLAMKRMTMTKMMMTVMPSQMAVLKMTSELWKMMSQMMLCNF
jgi:hypothetical protein